jgi:predicted Zn-dependent protease
MPLVTLVERGIVANLVYAHARATAQKMRTSEYVAKVGPVLPTGHGFPIPNDVGKAPLNVVFAFPAPEKAKTVQDMVATTERGILITRLWYTREVDP